MRILVASPYIPWPLSEGGKVAQFRTYEALRESCQFTLVVPVYSESDAEDAAQFSKRFPNVTVEAAVCYGPKPSALKSAVKKVRDSLRGEKKTQAAEPVPFYPFHLLPENFLAAVDRQLEKGCDIFQAEFAEMLSFGPFIAGRAPSVFVNHQLHFVYARRFMEANGANAKARYLTERIVREEAAFLRSFDATIVFSGVDRDALGTLCPDISISVSPFPSPEETQSPSPFTSGTRRFVFVASEIHGPNVDGLRWFMKEAWPSIKRALPGAIIEVIGKWSPASQAAMPLHEDILFSGFVPDLGQALQNKIMIVPVWIGSGIRTKILAAFSSFCPVVTTTVGVEGLPGRNGEHFLIGDDAAGFSVACIALAQDVNKMNLIASNGLDLMRNTYTLAAVRKTRMKIYEDLLARGAKKPQKSGVPGVVPTGEFASR
jgi:glycosyltransferase involved in cell wall biosynthesis